jgi:hypothetical protein
MTYMSSVRDRRKHTEVRRQHLRPQAPIAIVSRVRAPIRMDTRVHYAGDVPVEINREEWARLVAQLIKEEADGNKTRFAALAGTTYKTVNRWLNSEVAVSEESVREVARRLHRNAVDMLVRVGYYSATEFTAPEPPDPTEDPALRAILETEFPPRIKQRMIQRLADLRAAQRAREVDEVQWWIDQQRGA